MPPEPPIVVVTMAVTITVLGAGQVPGGLVVRLPGRPVGEVLLPLLVVAGEVGGDVGPPTQQLKTVGISPQVEHRHGEQPGGKVGPGPSPVLLLPGVIVVVCVVAMLYG